MIGRLLWNDIRNHKLLSLSTVIFMAASSLFISLAAVLFTGLLGSVDGLMERAVTPDYLQMHAGDIQVEKIAAFAEEHSAIEKWQIGTFLNLDNSDLVLGNKSLADSTQDNGLCVQNDGFDYLLDMDNVCPVVMEGEVYVPVCYRSVYDLNIGDKMQIGNEELVVEGFIRDSQMSSMMASSKRFLVGIGVLLISLLCIRFITALGVEQDRREVGMLKALGIENKHIRFLFFSKYILLSFVGAVVGFWGAGILKRPLSGKLRELYGASEQGLFSIVIAILVCMLVQGVILLFIRQVLKKFEKMSTLEALFSVKTQGKKAEIGQSMVIGLVAVACMVVALIPQNLCSTISAPEFVTYMGIGDARIRIDVRQSENIGAITEKLSGKLSTDPDVSKYVALKTISCPAILTDGTQVNLLVETGDHSVFPVKYAEGKQPEVEGEIALSSLQAQDLGLQIGDTLELENEGKRNPVVVCGIYSDITNGGKTAKVKSLSSDGTVANQVIWSILYVSLEDDIRTEQWMKEYKQYNVDIVNIADYVQGTYGPTIRQIEMAKLVAIGIAILIIMVVVMLFMRLLIEKSGIAFLFKKLWDFTMAVSWQIIL